MTVDEGGRDYRALFETMAQGVVFQDADGHITDANPAAQRILGLSLDQMQGRTSRDPRWKAVREDGSDFPGDEHPSMVALRTGEPVNDVTMGVFNPDDDAYRWISIDAVPLVPPGSDAPTGVYTTFEDITAQRQAEGALRDIEWMLSPAPDAETTVSPPQEQPYGDLTTLNTERTILESVGPDSLRRIAGDFLDLLGTSAAVYEKNGDYAFGIFSSGWCRFLDGASRALCETEDDAEALVSGSWLCHESCWTECSRKAIECGRPVDIECTGGIHLYGVPIFAGGSVVGSINVGHGDPPSDEQTLREIADRYRVPVEELRGLADAYQSRPPFIVELARRRLETAARIIGEAVERHRAECRRTEIERRYRDLVEHIGNCVAVYEAVDDGQDFVFREFNPAAEAAEGIERPDVLGRRVTEVFPGVEEFGLLDVFRRVYATGVPEDHPLSYYEDERQTGWRDNYVYRLPSGEIVAVYEDVTEQKLAEIALRDSEARFKSLFESSPDIIALIDSTGAILDINRVAPGYVREDVLGTTFADYLAGEQVALFERTLATVLETGEAQGYEVEIPNPDGLVFSWFNRVSPVASAGPAELLVVNCTDITEQKAAQAALRASEARLAASFEQSAIGMVEVDLDGRAVRANKRLTDTLGYTQEEFAGISFQEVTHPDDLDLDLDQFRRLAAGEIPSYTIEKRYVHKDGSTLWAELTVASVRDVRGRPEYFIAQVMDSTERRLADDALREGEARWRSYVEHAPFGVFVADERGRYLQVNPEACRITGHDETALLGMSISDLIPEDSRETALQHFSRLLEEGRSVGDVPFMTKSGDRRWWSVSAVKLSDGRLLGFVEDVTERKAAEEALRESEAFLSTIMKRSPFAMWVAGPDGVVVRTNDALRRTLGLREDQIVGSYNALEDRNLERQGVMPEVKAVFKQHEPARFTIYWTPEQAGDVDFSGGRALDIDASMFPIVGADGSLQNVVCQWVDVTDRVRAEAALSERVKELSCLNELSRLIGRPGVGLDEVLQGAADLLPPALLHPDTACARVEFEGAVYSSADFAASDRRLSVPIGVGGQPVGSIEVYYREERPERDEGPFLEEERELLEAVSRQLDRAIERHRADAALRESRERLRFAMEAAGEGTWEWDFTTGMATFDDLALGMLGYAAGEVEATADWWMDQVHPDDRPGVERAFGDYLAGRTEDYSEVFRLRSKDGGYIWVRSDAQVFRRDERGDPLLCVGIHRDITEEKRAEEERLAHLREQADLLRSMTNAFVIFESVFDDDGAFVSYRFEYINDAYERITGVTLDEVRGRTVHEVWPETEPSWVENYGAVAVSGETRRFEMFHKPTDKMYDCTVYRPWDTADRFCVVFEDITERKRRESALRESERRLREAQHIARMGDVTWNVETGEVWWSDGMHELTGYERTETFDYERVNAEIHHPDDLQRVTEWLRESVASGERTIAPNEYRIVRSDGEALWVHVEGVVARDECGAPTVFATVQDITESRRAEEALRESEEKYRFLFDHAEVLVSVYDRDGVCRLMNHKVAALFGGDPAEFVGKRFTELHPDPEAGEEYVRRVRHAIDSGTVAEYEDEVVFPTATRWLITTVHPVTGAEGGVPAAQIISHDITERKQAERALAELNAELEQRVIDRTAALEAVNAELESMTYSVSHDLRAPVRHIAGFTDLLEKKVGADLGDREHHYLERISASVDQMGVLIDDLLEFSRAGRVELEIEDIDMVDVFHAAMETVRPLVGDREIVWEVGELPSVTGDERLLRLVWVNLLDNAVKFTRTREAGRIAVAAVRGEGEVVFSVRDNGVGFDPRYAGKMFGVFQRMHSADEFEGTGIGLANVRRAIARLGGSTWAEGEPDKGAAFYFSVPAR